MRFALIDAEKAEFPVRTMCRVLDVSESGFFSWKGRPASQRQRDDMIYLAHIRIAFELSNRTYGSPRMHRDLVDEGLSIGRRRTARLMRENGLAARQKRRFKRTTDSTHAWPVAPNLLDQDFAAEAPDQKWSADISYIWTAEGWLYLAVLIDLFSRRVVGWAVSDRLKKDLALRALRMGTPLPRALRITEVDIDVGRQAEPAMVREFLAPVPGQGLVELGRQLPRLPDERGYHCQGFLVGNLYQHHVTRLTFDQGRDVAVLRSRQQITFPVTRHRPIFDRGRALTDRHHVRDLIPANAFPARLFRASDRTLRSKMLKQLLLKHTAGLNKQTAIDRLVRHLIRPSSWMRSLEPSGDLLR